jgi:hypothetical protein
MGGRANGNGVGNSANGCLRSPCPPILQHQARSDRRVGGTPSPTRRLRTARVHRGRRLDQLRQHPCGRVPLWPDQRRVAVRPITGRCRLGHFQPQIDRTSCISAAADHEITAVRTARSSDSFFPSARCRATSISKATRNLPRRTGPMAGIRGSHS